MELVRIEPTAAPPLDRPPLAGPTPLHRRLERTLALVALAVIATAWIAGGHRARSGLMPSVRAAVPDAVEFTRSGEVFQAWGDPGRTDLLAYVALGTAAGYGGPLTVAVALTPAGEVRAVIVADHKETTAWFERVRRRGLPGSLAGGRFDDPFAIGQDIDAVTGATITTRALGDAVLDGSEAAAGALGLPVTPAPPPRIQFGPREIVLILLFTVILASFRGVFPHRKLVRRGTMLTGLIVLGFLYNSPLTLTYISRALLGYWPSWRTDLHFYLLVFGVPLVILATRKNPYCHWFCPFGAAQECLGIMGGARNRVSARLAARLKWLPRTLALGAIAIGVYFRSPGLAGYEIFGTLFHLVGGTFQFVALSLVIVAALFITRPWCRFLCPVGPILDLVGQGRAWAVERWRQSPGVMD